jgi:LCP family protein required for cell wall assembly
MKKAIVIVITFILIVCLGVLGYGYDKYKDMTTEWYEPLPEQAGEDYCDEEQEQNVRKKKAENNEEANKPEEKEDKQEIALEPFNMLILGMDKRKGEKIARSDTIMLASVNPDLQKVTLLSIPRDTLAKIPGHGLDKFNHSMFYGGISLVKETMENFFQVEISHYAAVDFEGFIKIIDKLGGIEVDVERRMKYYDPTDGTNINLQPGVQMLDGKNALDYARFRMSDNGRHASDFDRMERQQEVIRKITDKATGLTSFFKIFAMMEILGEHVKTDFKEDEIRKLGVIFKNFSSSSIASIEVKGTNQRIPMHGYNLWFYVVSDEEKKRIRTIIGETLEAPPPVTR